MEWLVNDTTKWLLHHCWELPITPWKTHTKEAAFELQVYRAEGILPGGVLRLPSSSWWSAVTQEKRGELVQSIFPWDASPKDLPTSLFQTAADDPQTWAAVSLTHTAVLAFSEHGWKFCLTITEIILRYTVFSLCPRAWTKAAENFLSFLRWEYCSGKLQTVLLFFTYCRFSGMICLHLHLYDIEKYKIMRFLKIFLSPLLEISSNCTTSRLPGERCQ